MKGRMEETTIRIRCHWRWHVLWMYIFLLLMDTTEAQIRYTVPEELNQGSVVGNLAKDLGLSISDIYDRKLRIASDSGKQYFSVDLGKGELVVSDRIDREGLCGENVQCLLPLEVVVENPLQLHQVEIEIQDINDNSPGFLNSEILLEIAESTNPGAKFPLESASDPDVSSNGLRSYSINENDNFVLNIKTQDGTKIPELVLKTQLDREKQAVHKLVLTAVDGGNPTRSGISEITVVVLDNNDNEPLFEKAFYELSVPENTQIGTLIVNVKAIDSDEGPNGEIEYHFKDKTSETTKALFDVNSETGDITVKGSLDYE